MAIWAWDLTISEGRWMNLEIERLDFADDVEGVPVAAVGRDRHQTTRTDRGTRTGTGEGFNPRRTKRADEQNSRRMGVAGGLLPGTEALFWLRIASGKVIAAMTVCGRFRGVRSVRDASLTAGHWWQGEASEAWTCAWARAFPHALLTSALSRTSLAPCARRGAQVGRASVQGRLSGFGLANAAGSSTEVIFDGSHSCRSNVASDEPTNCHLLECEHQVLTHRPAESALNFARWDEITATGVVGTVRQGFAFCLNKARRGPASSQVLAVEIGSRFGFGNSL